MREIIPVNNNGSIQLKFTVNGKRYSFNPIKGGDYANKRDLAIARSIATKIQNDILASVFDPTLNRYRYNSTPEATLIQESRKKSSKDTKLLSVWDTWVKSLDLALETKANHYKCIRRMLEKANPSVSDVDWLITAKLSPSTFNKRLSYLKSCFKWAVSKAIVLHDPFSEVKSRKVIKSRIKPFNQNEMKSIISRFEYQYPHYVPFVAFLLMTGVRLGEAIGLQWKHINFERNEITVCETLSRKRTGNGYETVRKCTKTGSIRYLTMTPQVRDLLQSLGSKPSEKLVFTSARKCRISADNFREDWRQVLSHLGIEYRRPHTMRHTLLSHAIESGIPITGVAYIAGHSDTRMVMETYGHMINRPELPKIDI
ncbi:MAG: site-specific integrase [Phormidium tanganyikae FI6-MK23]|jgi:integrase|nr:site-specific integrase [Phormidium tanganyikae FI6-MK23]